MKTLNIIRIILLFPISIIMTPIVLIMAFFITDWSSKEDRDNAKELITSFFEYSYGIKI